MTCLSLSGCGNPGSPGEPGLPSPEKNYSLIGYDLKSPDLRYLLPAVLHEISGITVIDTSTIAAIQDENGVLFFFDLEKGSVRRHFFFHADGDYEGIARVGKTIYVLRSDAVLYEIPDYEEGEFTRTYYRLGLPAAESEGLCYDSGNNRLLIAPKSNIEDAKKSRRVVYGFDLKKKKLIEKPVIKFDLSEIRKYAEDYLPDLTVPGKKKAKKEFQIELRPSAIAIHPLTNRLYVISAIEKLLFVFNMEGSVEHIERFDPQLFNQPEGITFLDNGDMLISNEGGAGRATLLRFNYRDR